MTSRWFTTAVGLALLLPIECWAASHESGTPSVSADEKLVFALVKTSKGGILLELNNEKAPITVENFVRYANEGFYDGTIFHRVIDGFMIQGGGLTATLNKKPTRGGIKNEWTNGLKNSSGSIAMARLGRQPDSATAQFFINVADNRMLDRPNDGAGYAVFGRVVGGMKTVDKIRSVDTGVKNGMKDVPIETITIESVKIIPADEAKEHMKVSSRPVVPTGG